jgi:hypothetical protein
LRLTKEERETIIRTSEADATWEIFTDSPVMQRRLLRRGWSASPDGRTFTLPRKALTIRSRSSLRIVPEILSAGNGP